MSHVHNSISSFGWKEFIKLAELLNNQIIIGWMYANQQIQLPGKTAPYMILKKPNMSFEKQKRTN